MGTWRKSTHSGANGGSCVEVGLTSGIAVRDTTQANDPQRTMIEFSASAWNDFLTALK